MDDRVSSRWIGSPRERSTHHRRAHHRGAHHRRAHLLGVALLSAVLLGACGSDATDPEAATQEEPTTLALIDETTTSRDGTPAPTNNSPSANDSTPAGTEDGAPMLGLEQQLDDVEGMPGSDLTPERFEELRTDPQRRANVLAEMERQGLTADEAVCFLDNVSPELFITFGGGGTPDDAQFGELMELLLLCEVSFLEGR